MTAIPQFAPPSLLMTLTEPYRALCDLGKLLLTSPKFTVKTENAHPVIIIPGFGADGLSTRMLRNHLTKLGYNAICWGQGRNLGIKQNTINEVITLINNIFEETKQPVTLIGQSLGGIYAREIAKLTPNQVKQVITLGSPFNDVDVTGSRVGPLYNILNPDPITEFDAELIKGIHNAPPVPTTALYSKSDGVVDWKSCIQYGNDHTVNNIEIESSHFGMAMNRKVYNILEELLTK